MGNPNFDALLSTTLNNFTPRLEDNIFSARPLVYWLKSKDRIKTRSGGAKIIEPLIYGLNTTAGSYAGYDSIPTTPQDGISAAEYDWKQFAATVAISGIEEAKNRGEAEVIDLLESKIMQTEETITEKLDYMFFADGTGNGSKDWHGLAQIVEATGSLGGIADTVTSTDAAGSTVYYWRAKEENTAEVLTIARMTTMYNDVSNGNAKPDFVITTQTLFEKYESLLQPQLRFTSPDTADAGFDNLLFKGSTIMYDDYCTSGVVYFLNSKHLLLTKHSDVWFKTTPFVKPHGQDARYSQILLYGNLISNNRSRLGKLTAKTA